jgi:hypothetical protein
MGGSESHTGRSLIGLLLGALGGFIVLMYGNDAVHHSVCDNVPTTLNRTILCPDEFRIVDRAQAVATVQTYYGRVSGATPEAAYRLIGGGLKADQTREQFVGEWQDSLWAEVLEVHKAPGFNEYRIKFRNYVKTAALGKTRVPGKVVTWQVDLELSHAGHRVLVIDQNDLQRADQSPQAFPRVRLMAASATYRAPRFSSPTQALPSDFKVGGRLILLCTGARDDAVSSADEEWARTPQAWLPVNALDIHEAGVEGVTSCGQLVLHE